MVGVIIPVNNYLILARGYPGIQPVADLQRAMIEQYLSSWTSAKQKGLLACEEKIIFDGNSESWPVFRIEITGILISYGLL